MRTLLFAISLLLLNACGQAPSEPPADASISIENTWAAPTPNGVEVAAGYMTIVNQGDTTDYLLGAESPRAARVEIHTTSMDDDGVMRMQRADQLQVGAGESVALAPGGAHLMFMDITEPFAPGEEAPVRLRFEQAGVISVTLPVQRPPSTTEHTGH